MKSKILTFTLVFLSVASLAQVSDFKVTWGEKIDARRMIVTDILSTDNKGEFYAINQSVKVFNRETSLEKYENLKKTKEINLASERSRGEYEKQDIIELNGNLYSLNYVKTKEDISLTAEGVDKVSLALSGSKDYIYNFKLIKGRNNSYGEYLNAVSNEELRAAYVIEHPGERDSKSEATVKVFNDNFELQWKNKINLKSTNKLTDIYSITVSDEGTVYILTKVYKPKNERDRNERDYEFYLLSVTEEGIESEEKLQLQDNYIKDLKLDIGKNGELMCAGFYSKEGFRNDGVFYMTLDAENYSVKGVSMKKFDLDFITDGNGKIEKNITKKRADKGKDVGLKYINFRDIIVKEDGGALIIGEYYNSYTTMQTDANGSTTTTWHYHYDDIYVVSISPEGKIDWSIKIPKDQYSKNDYGMFSSFFLFVYENKLHIIFNDNLKNAGVLDYQDILKYNGRTKKSALMMVSIDSEGKYTREILVDPSKADGMRLRPKSCEQISEDEAILFAISKKHNKFAKVSLR
jgi:hypothetical protein